MKKKTNMDLNESKKLEKVIASTDLVNEATLAGVDVKTVLKEVLYLLNPILESADKLKKLQNELATEMYGDGKNAIPVLKQVQAELLSITNKNPYLRISKYV